MTIFDAFERIYLINLPERSDRLRDAMTELARAGIRPEDARLRIFAGIRPADAGVFPSRGAHGCHLSHLGIIREALRDQLHNVLIIEDDIALNPACLQEQTALVERLRQNDWDFAYPGHVENLPATPQAPAHWQHTRAPLVCAHFYGLNRQVLAPLEAYLRDCMERPAGHPDGGPMHIDGAYSMFRQRSSGLITLIAAPSLAGQRSSRSDIYPNRWFDRLPVFQPLATLARQLRHQCRQMRQTLNEGKSK
jgi:glycosyl transferase family 25